MKVLFVTSEVATIYKRGGLADVSHSLPVSLSEAGVQVSIALPYYDGISVDGVKCVGQLAVDYDRRRELVFVFCGVLPHSHVRVYLFRHPLFNDYDAPKIVERFAFFSKAVARMYLYSSEVLGGPYDILHCNDWHTALVPMLLGEHNKLVTGVPETIESKRIKTILTIHNLLYQGETGVSLSLKLGIPKSLFHAFTTPLGRAVRLLEEGMEYADRVTTVSSTYAKEIMKGMHGSRAVDVFARRGDTMSGIVNGLDTKLWDPRVDRALPHQYHAGSFVTARKENKALLQKAVRLPASDLPLFGFVGRLEARQKGLDILANAIKRLDDQTYQLVVLGTGQKSLVTLFNSIAEKHPNVAFVNTFDERLARRMYAGSDIMLVPSKFEPCGLIQLISMRYGAVPLVRNTGGLADTVENGVTGFVFERYTSTALANAIERAIAVYRDEPRVFRKMQERGLREDFSWKRQTKNYIKLYQSLV